VENSLIFSISYMPIKGGNQGYKGRKPGLQGEETRVTRGGNQGTIGDFFNAPIMRGQKITNE